MGRDRGNLMKSNRTEASKDPVSSNRYVRLQNCWNVMEEDQTDAGVADHDMIGCGAEVRLHLPSLSELAAKRHKSTHYIRAHKNHVVMACKKTKCHSKQKKILFWREDKNVYWIIYFTSRSLVASWASKRPSELSHGVVWAQYKPPTTQSLDNYKKKKSQHSVFFPFSAFSSIFLLSTLIQIRPLIRTNMPLPTI